MKSIRWPQIHTDAYALSLSLMQESRRIPKHFRPTLARRLEDAAVTMSLSVRQMLLTSKDAPEIEKGHMRTIDRSLEELRLILQMCHDLSVFPASVFGMLSEQVEKVGRQLGGMEKREPSQASRRLRESQPSL